MMKRKRKVSFEELVQENKDELLKDLKALERIEGVRILTPHCCRHTYVSQMIAMGVDPKTVQSIVGHADIDMTFYYAHAQEPQRQEAVQRFSEAFTKNGRGVHGNILDLIKSS